MANTIRKNLRDAIKTKLEAVTGVKTVSWQKRTNEEISPDQMPWITLSRQVATYEHSNFRHTFVSQPIDVILFLVGAGEDAADDNIDIFRERIKNALFADVRQGVLGMISTSLIEEFDGIHEDETLGHLRIRFMFKWDEPLVT